MEDIRIECNSNDIEVSIFTSHEFNGMVYPKGLAKNSTCMAEYTGQGSPVRYRLSLRNCNTMGVQQVSQEGAMVHGNMAAPAPALNSSALSEGNFSVLGELTAVYVVVKATDVTVTSDIDE